MASQGPSQPIDIGDAFIFEYEDLQEATKFFNPSEVVGEGGFGKVYRGELRDGRAVAIKELTVRDKKSVEQFFNEVRVLSQLHHKNLVALYGCTNPEDEKMLLVYEFVPNGTIADHLHQRRFSKKAFIWLQRLQIAIETTEALAYLHSLQPPIIHRDVKTNNILLDNSFNVKVADFGLCRLLPPSGAHISTMPQGTQGYIDPEYHQLYKLTTKSDVYSFGVVLIELISGKAVLDFERADDEIWLVNMAFNKMKNHQVEQLVDPELGYLEDPKVFSMVNSVAQLAYKCLQPRGHRRPSMSEVHKSLKKIRRLKPLREKSGDGSSALAEVEESLKDTSVDDASTRPMFLKQRPTLTEVWDATLKKIKEKSDHDSSALTEAEESLQETSVDNASTRPKILKQSPELRKVMDDGMAALLPVIVGSLLQ